MKQDRPGLLMAPLGARLKACLAAAIRDIKARSPLEPVTVVVPSRYSGYFLRQALVREGGGLFNVSFTRLEDMAESLTGHDEIRRPLSRLAASECIAAALAAAPSTGPLGALRDEGTVHEALHRTFNDLRMLGPEGVERLDRAGPIPSEVGRLWRAYSGYASPFYDRLEAARRAAEAVRSGDADLGRFGRLILLLVEAPPPQYRPLLDALIERDETVAMAGITGDTAADSLVESMFGHGGPAIASTSPDGTVTDISTRIVSVPDRSEELRWVIRNIVALAGHGARLGRIAIFYEDPAYGIRIDEALRLAGVPVAGPDPTTLAQRPEGRFITGILAARDRSDRRDLSRGAVMAWLTGAPVRSPDPSISIRASWWDAISRSARVAQGVRSWEDRLGRHSSALRRHAERVREYNDAAGSEERAGGLLALADEADALAVFMKAFATASEPPPDDSTWGAFIEWMRGLITWYFDQGYAYGGSALEREAAAERARQRDGILEQVERLDDIGGSHPTYERFCQTLRAELDQPVRSARTLSRGVFVAPLRDVVGTDFDAIHVVGMHEGRYPSAVMDDPLLPEPVRAAIDPDGNYLSTREQRRARSRRIYLTALGTSADRYLLWPRSESGRRGRLGPSRWLVEMASELEGIPLQGGDLLRMGSRRWMEIVESADPALNTPGRVSDQHEYDLTAVSNWVASGRPIEDMFLASTPHSPLGAGLRLEAARRSRQWTEWDGNLTGDDLPRITVAAEVVSPTRLETWAACPFRFFLGSVLGVTPLEEAEEEFSINAADRGTLMHNILSDFTRRFHAIAGKAQRLDALEEEERLAVLDDAAAQAFQAAEREGIVGKAALWHPEKERILRELRRFLSRDLDHQLTTGQVTMETELEFGTPGSPIPAVEVALEDGTLLRFRGRIDRLDMTADGKSATVIDYKTGGTSAYTRLDEDPVQGGRLLQLPVYGVAAQAHIGGIPEINTRYWMVSEAGGFKAIDVPLSDSRGRFVEAVGMIAGGITGGTFPAQPGKVIDGGFENCRYCGFDRVCPARRDRVWQRKSGSPGLAGFRRLMGLDP